MIEGGAVNIVASQQLNVIAESFRIGAEIVGVLVESTLLATSVLVNSLVNFLMVMTTNIRIVIWDII